MPDPADFQYDVALSFAGEDRLIVTPIADCLCGFGVKVFYDDFEKTRLWGKDLQEHFVNVYMRWARYALVFVSQHYCEKPWARHELRSALARALTERQEYVLPIRIDDTVLEGLLPTLMYLDLRDETPAEICRRVIDKIGLVRVGRKADQVSSPWSPSEEGSATFDYSSFNGRFRIGKDAHLFETAWSKASDVSIHCLNDPPSIRGIALAPLGTRVVEIRDAGTLDYTSRVRTPKEGQVVVLENINGFFAALHVIGIKDATRNDDRDELSFRYWILRDGNRDFSRVAGE